MLLEEFFKQNPRVALGFSGGVDSSYLLYEGQRCGADICAYYVKTPFQPAFELEDAKRLAAQLGAVMKIIEFDVLECGEVRENPDDRCYYCKRLIFGLIARRAKEDGFEVIIDGTNASDDADDRPGMRALGELKVFSPLRLCGVTKAEIRARSREAGLFTWDKPAYACLATRVPTGIAITHELLERTERAEAALRDMGFHDLRVRLARDGSARIQLSAAEFARAAELHDEIFGAVKDGYTAVTLDLKPR